MTGWKDIIKSVVDNTFALAIKLWWVWPILAVLIALKKGWIDEHTFGLIYDKAVGLFGALKGLL